MTSLTNTNCVEMSVVVPTKGYVEQTPIASVGYLGRAPSDCAFRLLLSALKTIYPHTIIRLYVWELKGGDVPMEVLNDT